MNYLVVKLGNNRFAFEIKTVLEILIPGTAGIESSDKILLSNKINYRKNESDEAEPIPVFGLADFALKSPFSDNDNFKVVVCERGGEFIGLLVDNADEILKLEADGIKPAGEIDSDVNSEILSGYVKEEHGNLYLLSLGAVFSLIKAS